LIKFTFSHHNLCFKSSNEKCELIFNIYFTNIFSIIYRRFNLKKVWFSKPCPKNLKHSWYSNSQSENPLWNVGIRFFALFHICEMCLSFGTLSYLISLSCLNFDHEVKVMTLHLQN
jgi:hypothetical protein